MKHRRIRSVKHRCCSGPRLHVDNPLHKKKNEALETKNKLVEEKTKRESKIPLDVLSIDGHNYQFKTLYFHSVLTPSKKIFAKDVLDNEEQFSKEIQALLLTDGQKVLVPVS